ncbi:hypothetical protein L2W58_08140 [Dethiosulfovibrio sp. F2B]|uniref:hypothetical protein n=1 Tax=Dethiosulfovibrio faecalis TaxID=2720018 RepID=UPI001F36D731|nr:hypothetical protein [Dethiosulfovibrio faecalis]MCF4151771.1 hypothetical protein [Dethiosulfovibrio faecalis]
MKTVRDLMERLQKLIDKDESWLDAEVEAHSIYPPDENGDDPHNGYALIMWPNFEMTKKPESDWHPKTVNLVFVNDNLGDFM